MNTYIYIYTRIAGDQRYDSTSTKGIISERRYDVTMTSLSGRCGAVEVVATANAPDRILSRRSFAN